ncbi:DUF3108 domain-containing protein [uncultured Paraglaciecola sp.]|mgnify:CR=1 FL=1|uniref:DUF3108 domain-containing protein n=1 Tax=uncultured Paraglaciecola sp. TaxID=1765024 RepID=UPI0030DB3292|tara:strand:+ start:50969 stop:51712 length:744 start_codon:yes stop_codon:yes gene_type:complete
MRLNKSIVLLSLTLLLGLTFGANKRAYADTDQLVGFEAEYLVYRFNRSLGKAKLVLKADKNDLYRLDYYSKVSAFFLSDIRSETSFFSFNNSQLHPLTYAYSRSGTGSNKSTKIHFDNEKSSVTINQAQPINWSGQLDNQLYRLDVQLKLASGKREFEYDVINNRGELRHYELKVVGKEQLDLPFGMIEGIKVKIIRNNSSRETIAWFSPQLNYQLVKLTQFKDGDEQGEIRLKYFKSENSDPKAKN